MDVDPMEGLIPEDLEEEILDKDDSVIYKGCSFRGRITISTIVMRLDVVTYLISEAQEKYS